MRIFDCCQLMLIVFNPINYSYLMTSHNNRIMKNSCNCCLSSIFCVELCENIIS